MSYQPEPASVAARVIAYLGTKPAGYVATAAELSRQLGVPATSFHGCLTSSMNAGLVVKRNMDELGRSVGFALGPGLLRSPVPDTPRDDIPVFLAAPDPVDPPTQEQAQADPVAEEIMTLLDEQTEGEPFACAVFNDGRLYLELGAETMTLQVQHTRVLLRYLERIVMP